MAAYESNVPQPMGAALVAEYNETMSASAPMVGNAPILEVYKRVTRSMAQLHRRRTRYRSRRAVEPGFDPEFVNGGDDDADVVGEHLASTSFIWPVSLLDRTRPRTSP